MLVELELIVTLSNRPGRVTTPTPSRPTAITPLTAISRRRVKLKALVTFPELLLSLQLIPAPMAVNTLLAPGMIENDLPFFSLFI
ncbi:hypothetical protein Pint_16238 [Pistacia integerrima]|uniref:Uncharacterized protein n=1 Tax=Pistacia integerrima TaxID=434235 RepID=A0ACC0ZAI2_9ROSI|nr:hypothetical protein Pint_16238 [Pistacia integerrima]